MVHAHQTILRQYMNWQAVLYFISFNFKYIYFMSTSINTKCDNIDHIEYDIIVQISALWQHVVCECGGVCVRACAI